MDKSPATYDGIDLCDCGVHHLPRGMRKLHEEYGLWICRYGRKGVSRPPARLLPRRFEFFALSHLLRGHGFYWTPARGFTALEPGDMVVVTPGTVHAYGGDDGDYEEDTINFTGPIADRLARCRIIRDGVIRVGDSRRLLPVIEQATDPSDSSQLQANLALQTLLVELHLERRTRSRLPPQERIAHLQEQLLKTRKRWWTVAEMAEYCQLSPSRFRIVFEKTTGIQPKRYIDRIKVQSAAEQLVGTDRAVGEIAFQHGYQDPFHFSRRFKAVTGFSPTAYREEMRS